MDKLIAEARAALDGTTPGPWYVDEVGVDFPLIVGPYAENIAEMFSDEGPNAMRANARFIAWARECVPALIAALEAAQADNARLRAALLPFAEAADECEDWGSVGEDQAPVSAEMCFQARAALDPTP